MQDRLSAPTHESQKAFMQQIGCLIVDHASHERLGIGERLVHDQPLGQLLQLGHDLVVDGIEDDQSPRRRASLARRGEGGLDDERRRIVDLRRVEHDDGVVAPHFERHDLVRFGGELAIDRDACARRSGEKHPVDKPVPHQRLAFVRPADQQLDHAFGYLRGVEAFYQEFRRRRRFLAGFEDHRVPGDQRRNDMAIGKVGGKIIRPQHGHHAMRLVPHSRRTGQRAV